MRASRQPLPTEAAARRARCPAARQATAVGALADADPGPPRAARSPPAVVAPSDDPPQGS